MSYLNELNSKQRAAAEHLEGPLLILAGAGAGKTKTITYRIANLISKGVEPRNILAVTFTNKAATEMRERVDKILTDQPELKQPIEFAGRPTIRTFHSLGVLILRENFGKLGLLKNFSILDKADCKKIVRDILKEEGYDPKQHDPGKILGIISKQKGDMVTVEEYASADHYNYMSDVVTVVWRKYEKVLADQSALDFDDLLIKSTELLRKDPELRKYYQNRWKYVHVDEYQDTNAVQYQMTKFMAEEHNNICVVGDIDQNIYSWRGATIKNILNFEKDYPGATEIILEENYRSTQNILRAANDVIAKNKNRREKNLFTKNTEGDKVKIYRAIDEYDEATFAVLKSKEMIDQAGVDPNEIAFLYRANFQSRVLEEICLQYNLPYQVIGTKFFDRKEIKDIIAYIKAAINEKDFTNLNRIINYPARGIGKVTLLKIHAGEEGALSPAVKAKVQAFRDFMKKIRESMENQKPHEIIQMILKESGLEEALKKEGDEGLERIENIKELASLAKKYEHLEAEEAMQAFMESVSLTSDQDELDRKTEDKNDNKDGVKLMTVHASKGLEFDYVFVTGLEAGLFPHHRDDDKDDDEEERRLFYVALTRARKAIYLTWASFRTIFGSKEVNMASEFLDDIDDEISELEDGIFGNNDDGNNDSKDGVDEDPDENGSGEKVEYLIDF
jgi:DNA helicase-2/ATP-dependent DNA helicase PcrA